LIFGSTVCTQIRPVRLGDLGTRQKNSKFLWFRHENRRCAVADIAENFVSTIGDGVKKFSALSATAINNFTRCHRQHSTFFTALANNAHKFLLPTAIKIFTAVASVEMQKLFLVFVAL
jgi:hypothetical protein